MQSGFGGKKMTESIVGELNHNMIYCKVLNYFTYIGKMGGSYTQSCRLCGDFVIDDSELMRKHLNEKHRKVLLND